MRQRIAAERAAYEADQTSLDVSLPPLPFDAQRPATFALVHLLRILVLEAKAYQFVPHDGLDFCHATLAASYASVATLDKQWKRRVEQLPHPNRLARIFYRPELDDLVTEFERLVA